MPADGGFPRSVWVIDDDALVREIVMRRMEAEGCRVRGFGSAEPALEALAAGAPDAAVLDNGLPGMMGIQALPVLSRAGVRVVMVTGYSSEDVHKDALLLGAGDFMTKPLDLEDLSRRLRGLRPKR
jgi:two-component system response regulator MprA